MANLQGSQLSAEQECRLAAIACVVHAKDAVRSMTLLNDRYSRATKSVPSSWDLVAAVRGKKVPVQLRKDGQEFVASFESGEELR